MLFVFQLFNNDFVLLFKLCKVKIKRNVLHRIQSRYNGEILFQLLRIVLSSYRSQTFCVQMRQVTNLIFKTKEK